MNFLNYLLKAKGRHGTHSPYIYKFVEDALHENNALTWNYPKDVNGKKARKLFRVISYLTETQQLIVTTAALRGNAWLRHFSPSIKDPDHIIAAQQTSITVLSLEEIDLWKDALFTKGAGSGSALLLLHPGNPDYTLLEDYFKRGQFNATIFTWDFSILMNRPDFKRKQHFILR